jgi:nucleoside-diphosphate-sugar epimerase
LKALVTGGNGFIGSSIVRRLLKEDHEVRVIARNQRRVNLVADLPIEFIQGDILDEDCVNTACDGVDIVFHFASLFRSAGLPDSHYRDVHVKGTEMLLRTALKHKVKRFIHCSTVGVLGHIKNPPANEKSPYNPGDIYQITKVEGEKFALKFYQDTALPLVVIRPAPVYGPGDTRLLKLFKIAKQKVSLVIGKGDIFFHMIYIDDLVQGIIQAATHEKAVGEIFIIGSEENLFLNDLIDLMADVLNAPKFKLHLPAKPFQLLGSACETICKPLHINPPIFRRRVDFFTKSRSFDISKAKTILGYQPHISLKTGLERTAKWYKENGMLS